MLLCAAPEQARAVEYGLRVANLMNDGAVILHYYLHRDYDRAQALYEKAIETADALLAAPDKLSADEKALARKAKREATDNLANLAKGVHEWRG